MCFSASSSFTAAVLLSGIGIYALKNYTRRDLCLIAAIPLLFGVQQAFEGIVWLTIADSTSFIHTLTARLFLLFAGAVWPALIPTAFIRYGNAFNKKLLYVCAFIGYSIALYTVYQLITAPIMIEQINKSIFYHVPGFDDLHTMLLLVIYTLPTVLPLFLSKLPYARINGGALVLSMMIAYYMKYETFGSVWCFFAALLSIGILFSLDAAYKEQQHESIRY